MLEISRITLSFSLQEKPCFATSSISKTEQIHVQAEVLNYAFYLPSNTHKESKGHLIITSKMF